MNQVRLPAAARQTEARARFAAAVRHYETGRLAEAQQICRQVLALDPNHVDAWQLIGIVALQSGNYPEAAGALGKAVARNGKVPDLHNALGEALRGLGRFDEAVGHFGRAIALAPNFAPAYANLATALGQQGKRPEAVAAARRAVTLAPGEAIFHYNLGNALAAAGAVDEAMASLRRALGLNPNYAEAYLNLGNAHRARGEPGEAAAYYQRALALRPDFLAAYGNLGALLMELRRHADAVSVLRQATAIAPVSAGAHVALAGAFRAAGQLPEAVAAFDRALALQPGHADALAERGEVMRELRRFEESAGDFAQLLAIAPDYDYATGSLVYSKILCCDWRDYDHEVAQVSATIAAGKRAAIPFMLVALSDSPAEQLRAAQIFGRDRRAGALAAEWRGPRRSHDRIRVAYVSGDLRHHAVAYLMAGIFEAHDRSRFETIAVSLRRAEDDDMQARLKPLFDRFIDVHDKGDAEIAQLLGDLEVDIAVDLMGYTLGMRPAILGRRPAPVQVNYLGFPGTMGVAHIDYLIADRFVIPEALRDCYAETIAYLPDCYLPNDAKRAIAERTPSRAECGLPDQGFVFCCFNNSYKITPAVFDVWMRLLRAVEGSVLWVRQDTPLVVANLRREAQERGIAPERLVFAERVERVEDHLARHRVADLFLDTLPFNAHSTAADALWTGLPVVTCAGSGFAGRVAGSLLHAVGLPELVARSLADYEALALSLARDPAALAAAKAKLVRNRDTHPLFDTDRFRRHLESAYETMWARHLRGERPASFAVDASGG